jgi:MFS family permease
MLTRNIRLAYLLVIAKNTWFWLGIWVFFYLRFTNYAGIGLAETVLILTLTLAEIPTGAIADLFGKKNTLILAFLFETIGGLIMTFAANFPQLLFSIFVLCLGGALYSGTLEALVFDTLKQSEKTDHFSRIISRINGLGLITPAICSIVGGFFYVLDPRLPFLANSLGYFVGLLGSLFLTEPKIDSVKFSISGFLFQTRQGLSQLFQNSKLIHQTTLLLGIGFIIVICSEMLNSFLGVEFGFNPESIGILWALIFLISALTGQLTPWLNHHLKPHTSAIILGIIISFTLIISPVSGLFLGSLLLIIRNCSETIYNNLSSIIINHHTDSKYRATTISTFNMIKNIPYVLFAFYIGSLSDHLSAKTTAFYLGILLLIFLIILSAKDFLLRETSNSQ